MDPITIALIGLGVGTATSAGASIFNAARSQPEIPGPSGEQRLGQSMLQATAGQLASGRGLSESEYNRPIEAAQRQVAEAGAQGMEATRSASPFISNIAAERIAKEMSSRGAQIISDITKQMTSMDIRQAREDLKASVGAQAAANQQANEIARIERERKEKEEAWRNQKIQGIISVAGNAANSFMKLASLMPATPSASPEVVAQGTGIAGAPEQVWGSIDKPLDADGVLDKIGSIGAPSGQMATLGGTGTMSRAMAEYNAPIPSGNAFYDTNWEMQKLLHAGLTPFEEWQMNTLYQQPSTKFLQGGE